MNVEEFRDKFDNMLSEIYDNRATLTLLEVMINCKSDGIVFYQIMSNKVICEYTLEEFKNIKDYPKSNWRLYKIVEGKREWI